jgi:hypothetical protein
VKLKKEKSRNVKIRITKNRITLSLILSVSLLMIISSCGSEGGNEAVKAEVDCECNKLFDARGIELGNQDYYDEQVFTNAKADAPFTGTCAILSEDRSKDTIALHSFEKGFRSKRSAFEIIDGEKIQTSEYSFNDKDQYSGWNVNIKTNKNLNFSYVKEYLEYKNEEVVYSYRLDYFSILGDDNRGTFVFEKNGKMVFANYSSYEKDLKRRDDCRLDGQLFTREESEKASVKSFLECVTKMKLKKWWYKFDSK